MFQNIHIYNSKFRQLKLKILAGSLECSADKPNHLLVITRPPQTRLPHLEPGKTQEQQNLSSSLSFSRHQPITTISHQILTTYNQFKNCQNIELHEKH